MVDLTVGHVSGIIAAGINVLQFLIPTATTLILAGLLSEQNSLATWTQIGRSLHSSHWPLLLRADYAGVGAVSRAVRVEGTFRFLILLIVGIAAVVTPLGLYDSVVPGESSVPQPFRYQNDISPFGAGTPPRANLGFNRLCGSFLPLACPGSKTVVHQARKGDTLTVNLTDTYDLEIPANLTEMFQSGLKDMPPTMSSIFDIQWRSYAINLDEKKNNGSAFLVGNYKQVDNLLLRDGYMAVEGLIVDTKGGGIGFRNHTIPAPHLKYGSLWSEDLLFIEPSTKCVDTNITVDFTIPDYSYNSSMSDVKLTDHGGFSKLNTTYPQYDRSDPQKNPDLYGRAFKAAYLHNAYTMLLLNVTNPRTATMKPWSYMNSKEGQSFPVDIFFSDLQATQLGVHKDWLLWHSVPFSTRSNFTVGDFEYPNPYDVVQSNFSSISTICHGAGDIDYANITNIGVACGLVVGAARRADGSFSLVARPREEWTVPLYSCASSARAVVKTVDFRYNGTNGLRSLFVENIRDKIYAKDSDKPLWAVEQTKIQLRDMRAMWGLVSDQYKDRPDVSVVQSDGLWLPGLLGESTAPVDATMNLPGVSFHMNAFASIYSMSEPSTLNSLGDYSGRSNFAMFARWQNLSRHASTTPTIINQIWTDIAANAVVGTKGWVNRGQESDIQRRAGGDASPREGQLVDVPVNVYRHQVKFRIAYGIPAFIVLSLVAAIAASSCVLCVFGRSKPSVVRKYLSHTAAGRLMGTFVYPGQVDQQAPTQEWNAAVGANKVSMAGPVPHPSDPVMMAPYSNFSKTNMDDPLLQAKGGVTADVNPIQTHHPQGYHSP